MKNNLALKELLKYKQDYTSSDTDDQDVDLGFEFHVAPKIELPKIERLTIPDLPARYGVFDLISLGVISSLPGYHNSKHIFPIGFQTQKSYHSTMDPDSMAVYTFLILESPKGPIFQITASDNSRVFDAASATGAWNAVLKEVYTRKGRDLTGFNSVSGIDAFGLSNPQIKELIQILPNAADCTKYNFEQPIKKRKKKKEN
jgi:F/Y rich C-terminus/F/Y-rich N-terminus